MFKKLLYGLIVCAGLVSCTEDYTDWLSPQSNAAKDALQKVDLMVQPTVSSVKIAEQTSETIQLFSANITGEGAYSVKDFELTLKGNDKEAVITSDVNGVVKVDDLANAIISLYGKAPKDRPVDVSVFGVATVKTEDGIVSAKKLAESYKLTVTPDAPLISQNYYVVGATLDWQGSAISKEQKFSHSDADVYEDPIFTIIINGNEGGDTWFAIGDDEACDAIRDNGDWSKLLGSTKGNGCSDPEGQLAPRYQLGNDGSLKVENSPKKIKITLNMMDGTYKIEAVPEIPEYYIVGRQNGWSMSKVSALYPTSGTTVSYTSYFTGAWDCRIGTPENAAAGTWDDDFGAATGNGDASCTILGAHTNNCMASPGEGYYTLNVDFASMTYSWTKLEDNFTSYDKIGLVGAGDDWDNDIFLTKVYGSGELNGADTHNWSALGVELKASTWGVKFRANASWDKDWGCSNAVNASGSVYGQSDGGSNIELHEAGLYNIYFNDITGQFFFVKL